MVKTSAVPRRSPATGFRVIDGQAIITDAANAQIHVTNDVGAMVWRLVDGTRTVEEIVSELSSQFEQGGEEEYEQVPADLTADVTEFLEDLASRGIIEMSDREG